MSTGNRPVGDIVAIVDRLGRRGESDFVRIAPVWESEKGNLSFTLNVEPIAWRNALARRSCMFRCADGVRHVVRREGNKPVADIVAIVDRPDRRGEADFIPLASVWESKKGSLVFTFQAIPVAWLDETSELPRRCMMRIRTGVEFTLERGNFERPAAAPADSGPDIDVDLEAATSAGGDDDIPF